MPEEQFAETLAETKGRHLKATCGAGKENTREREERSLLSGMLLRGIAAQDGYWALEESIVMVLITAIVIERNCNSKARGREGSSAKACHSPIV